MRTERRRELAYQAQRLAQRGASQRAIARALGVARRTVKRLLEEIDVRREQGESALLRELVPPRTPRAGMLDEHEDRIRGWLVKWPKLTATRCMEKLQEVGFTGGYTIVRERFRRLKAELVPAPPPATPFHTSPGQRAEFDWSPYQLAEQKIQLWNCRLRWSRAASLAGEDNCRQTTILRNLRASFEDWGGVPRECLTDSMKGVVDRWECDRPILNARMVDFAAHYGFIVLIAPRGCPQWKAIAENLFRFHEGNLLNGRDIPNLGRYRPELAEWRARKLLDRPHPEQPERTIGEMLDLERSHLLPLPGMPYDTRDVYVRLVDDYRRVQLDTNHYPVPAPVGSLVYLCADALRVEICDAHARRLIEHERLPDGAGIKLDPPQISRARYDTDELIEQISAWGEQAEEYARRLREVRRTPGPELVRLLQLQVDWSLDDIVSAIDRAAQYRCYEVSKLQRILEVQYTPRRYEELIAERIRERVRGVMQDHPVAIRRLDSYASLQHGDSHVTWNEPQEEEADGPQEPADDR